MPQRDSWPSAAKREVVAHRHRQHQAFGLAVLGDQRHADLLALGHARTGDLDRLAVDQHLARRAAQHAEERQQQFALALAVEPTETDHLAGMQCKRDVVEPVAPAEVAQLEPRHARVCDARLARRKYAAVFATDHQLDDLVVGLRARRIGGHAAAVAEHRALVGELGDLVHAVRDVDQGQAFGAQALEHGVDLRHVGGRQRRRGLVEDQDARLARQRLGDLDHLAARQRQVLDQRQRMDVLGAGAGQRLFGHAGAGPGGRSGRSAAAGC